MRARPRVSVRGGDPDCVHWFVFGRPESAKGTRFIRERGVCRKCGAVQEFLRRDYEDWGGERLLSISDVPVVKEVGGDRGNGEE